jgi:hypothetical protein
MGTAIAVPANGTRETVNLHFTLGVWPSHILKSHT